MSVLFALLLSVAQAADLEQSLTWNLSVGGKAVGTREVTVKYVPSDLGRRRIIESWTELDGMVGPIRVNFRQRMTAHASEREPASFHSVAEQNGTPIEVQARWTPSAWWITTNQSGRQRTVDMPLNRVDISTADLMDPESRYPLSRFVEVRVLSAETGDVLTGPVEDLGVKELRIADETLQAHGYAWTSSLGKSVFWFSADGFLVKYTTRMMGVSLDAELAHPPPPGVDDFAVGYGAPAIEVIPL